MTSNTSISLLNKTITNFNLGEVLKKFNPIEVGKLVMFILQMILQGKTPDVHLIFDIRETKFSIALYDDDKKLFQTEIIDL